MSGFAKIPSAVHGAYWISAADSYAAPWVNDTPLFDKGYRLPNCFRNRVWADHGVGYRRKVDRGTESRDAALLVRRYAEQTFRGVTQGVRRI